MVDTPGFGIMPKQKYQHKLDYYPGVYGCSFRTVQRYSKLGYPLDDVEATQTLIAGQRTAPAGSDSTTGARGPQTAVKARQGASDTPAGALGLSAAISRLQRAEAEAHRDYENATAGADKLTKQKAWITLSEQLRKVEQSNPDIEEQKGNAVDLDTLRAALGSLFGRLRQDLDTLPKRIAGELVGQDAIGTEQIVRREVEEIILSLYRCEYLTPQEGKQGE